MEKNLWKECLTCKDKCCKWWIAFPLFSTPEEKLNLNGINTRHPCIFFNQNELCDIHNIRPYDCRFFPFEILKFGGKFFWIIWNLNCAITNNRTKEEFEPCLQEHEQELIPKFKEYIDGYEKFRKEEFLSKCKYEVLREVKIKPPSP